MTQLSTPAPGVPASPSVTRILAASRRPSNLGGHVPGAVSLAMGEPDSTTAPAIVARAVASLESGRTHYAPANGEPKLLNALAENLQSLAGYDVEPENIVLGHGGTAVLAAVCLAVLSPGDRVLIPEPTYSLYADLVALAGAEPVWVPPKDDGSWDIERIVQLLPTVAMLVLCNPSNPTGDVLTGVDLAKIAAAVEASPQVVLLSDEAYSDIVFDGVDFVSALRFPEIAARTVRVGTFSKTYAMTGWRLGHAVAPPELTRRINLIHRTFNGSLTTFSQDAALQALRTPSDQLQEMRDGYERRRDIVLDALAQMERISVTTPKGAFYAFPRVHSSLTSEQLVDECARGGVLVRAGSEYGPSGDGFVRLSFAAGREDLNEGLARFGAVVDGLPA